MRTKLKALMRLAWRECRTHWVRSIVMVLLIAVPVAGLLARASITEVDVSPQASASRVLTPHTEAVFSPEYERVTQDAYRKVWTGDDDRSLNGSKRATEQQKYLRNLDAQHDVTWLIKELKCSAETDDGSFAFTTSSIIGDWNVFDFDYEIYPFATFEEKNLVDGRVPTKPKEITISSELALLGDLKIGDTLILSTPTKVAYEPEEGKEPEASESITLPQESTMVTIVGITSEESLGISAGTFPDLEQTVWQSVTGKADNSKFDSQKLARTVLPKMKFATVDKKPVTWNDVKEANEAGIFVISRSVINDPPSANEVPQERHPENFDASAQAWNEAPLAIYILSIFMGLGVFAIMLLIPISVLFGQSMIPTGRIVRSVGATQRQWSMIVILVQLILAAIGIILGTLVAVIAAWGWIARFELPFVWWPIPLAYSSVIVIAVMVGVLISALIGHRIVAHLASANVITPRPASKKVFFFGLGLALTMAVLFVATMASQSIIFVTFPLMLTFFIVGICLMIPMLFMRWDMYLTRRYRQRGSVSFKLARRDVYRRRHRTVPAIVAIVAATSVAVLMGVMSASDIGTKVVDGSLLRYGYVFITAPETVSSSGDKNVGTSVITFDEEARKHVVDRVQDNVAQQMTLGESSDLYGGGDIYSARHSVEATTASGTKTTCPRVEEPEGASTDPPAPPLKEDVNQGDFDSSHSDNNSERIIQAWDLNSNAGPSTTLSEGEHDSCRYLLLSARGASAMMNSATIAYLVDNGSYLSFASSIDSVIDPTEREKAIAVLKEGGVVVSDPSVIDNGKTTLHHSIDIDGKVEKHTLTVQAVAYPLPINLTGAVMMSPQVADELGVDVQLVGRAIQADDWWINGKSASEYNESGIHLPGVYVAQISAAEVGSYVMSWSFTGIITLFVIVMLVLLSGLETRSSLKLYNSVGAHPNLRRRFSAWYAFLTALYGSIGGIICGFLVMGLFKVASWVSYYVHDGQTFSPVENTGITVLIIVTLGLVVITPLVAAVVGALLAPKADPVRINH